MPEHLSPAAREEWRRVVPALLKLGVLAAMDQGALSSYCTAHSVALEAEAAIAAGGVIVEEIVYNREGDEVGRRTKPNPACKVLSDMLRLKKAYGIEFGLTSASRTRLHIEKPKEPDEFDLYLAGVKERRSRPIPQDDEPEMDPQFPPQ
jgi:P27 family predicted phage terminase small subunit